MTPFSRSDPTLVAQCSATPATVAATPPCSATPKVTFSDPNLDATPPGTGGGGCDTKIFRGEQLRTPPAPPKFTQLGLRTCLLSGPLDRLNAILSLLQPLDRYRTPSAIGSAIGRPLFRPISHPRTGRSPQPPRSKPLRGLNRAIVAL